MASARKALDGTVSHHGLRISDAKDSQATTHAERSRISRALPIFRCNNSLAVTAARLCSSRLLYSASGLELITPVYVPVAIIKSVSI